MTHVDAIRFQNDIQALKWIVKTYPLYLHDISSYTDAYQLDDEGNWQPDYVGYWIQPESPTLVAALEYQDKKIGFVCIGIENFPFKDDDSDYKLSEFFIIRQFRKLGLAKAAMSRLFQQMPGRWELDVLKKNLPAMSFWESVLASYEVGIEEHEDFRRFKCNPQS